MSGESQPEIHFDILKSVAPKIKLDIHVDQWPKTMLKNPNFPETKSMFYYSTAANPLHTGDAFLSKGSIGCEQAVVYFLQGALGPGSLFQGMAHTSDTISDKEWWDFSKDGKYANALYRPENAHRVWCICRAIWIQLQQDLDAFSTMTSTTKRDDKRERYHYVTLLSNIGAKMEICRPTFEVLKDQLVPVLDTAWVSKRMCEILYQDDILDLHTILMFKHGLIKDDKVIYGADVLAEMVRNFAILFKDNTFKYPELPILASMNEVYPPYNENTDKGEKKNIGNLLLDLEKVQANTQFIPLTTVFQGDKVAHGATMFQVLRYLSLTPCLKWYDSKFVDGLLEYIKAPDQVSPLLPFDYMDARVPWYVLLFVFLILSKKATPDWCSPVHEEFLNTAPPAQNNQAIGQPIPSSCTTSKECVDVGNENDFQPHVRAFLGALHCYLLNNIPLEYRNPNYIHRTLLKTYDENRAQVQGAIKNVNIPKDPKSKGKSKITFETLPTVFTSLPVEQTHFSWNLMASVMYYNNKSAFQYTNKKGSDSNIGDVYKEYVRVLNTNLLNQMTDGPGASSDLKKMISGLLSKGESSESKVDALFKMAKEKWGNVKGFLIQLVNDQAVSVAVDPSDPPSKPQLLNVGIYPGQSPAEPEASTQQIVASPSQPDAPAAETIAASPPAQEPPVASLQPEQTLDQHKSRTLAVPAIGTVQVVDDSSPINPLYEMQLPDASSDQAKNNTAVTDVLPPNVTNSALSELPNVDPSEVIPLVITDQEQEQKKQEEEEQEEEQNQKGTKGGNGSMAWPSIDPNDIHEATRQKLNTLIEQVKSNDVNKMQLVQAAVADVNKSFKLEIDININPQDIQTKLQENIKDSHELKKTSVHYNTLKALQLISSITKSTPVSNVIAILEQLADLSEIKSDGNVAFIGTAFETMNKSKINTLVQQYKFNYNHNLEGILSQQMKAWYLENIKDALAQVDANTNDNSVANIFANIGIGFSSPSSNHTDLVSFATYGETKHGKDTLNHIMTQINESNLKEFYEPLHTLAKRIKKVGKRVPMKNTKARANTSENDVLARLMKKPKSTPKP